MSQSKAERDRAEQDLLRLLGLLSHREPHVGWQNVRDLPEITDADVAIVLAAEPDLIADSFSTPQFAHLAIEAISLPGEREISLGVIALYAIRDQVRRYLLKELIVFSERANADGIETHGCISERDAGVPARSAH